MPRLFVRDVSAEIEFCKRTFEAVALGSRPGPDGKPMHALLTIGPAMIMLEAERPEVATRPPQLDGSSPVVIFVYVPDVDAALAAAVANGGKILMPVDDHFTGDRLGWVMDPEGHVWTIASRIEETTEEERAARWSSILAESSKK